MAEEADGLNQVSGELRSILRKHFRNVQDEMIDLRATQILMRINFNMPEKHMDERARLDDLRRGLKAAVEAAERLAFPTKGALGSVHMRLPPHEQAGGCNLVPALQHIQDVFARHEARARQLAGDIEEISANIGRPRWTSIVVVDCAVEAWRDLGGKRPPKTLMNDWATPFGRFLGDLLRLLSPETASAQAAMRAWSKHRSALAEWTEAPN